MTPDYQRAAIAATEILISRGINSTPVSPLPILKSLPGVLVVSYQSLSDNVSQDRQCLLSRFSGNQDAFTSVHITDGTPHYIVTYNQQLSLVLIQRSLARELGHIVLGHDGTRPEDVRNAEARCFAHHLLCPRPLLHMVQASGIRFTVEVLGTLTGCYDSCLACMREIPAVRVPADLNRAVRDQFSAYFRNYFEYHRTVAAADGSALAYLGTYMDGYEE